VNGYLLGLSLIALSPAAAWYVIVILYRFFAPPGEKTIQKELIMAGKRKSYSCINARPWRQNRWLLSYDTTST